LLIIFKLQVCKQKIDLFRNVQMKNRIVSECANENLSIGILFRTRFCQIRAENVISVVKLALQHLFINNFLTEGVQTKNHPVSQCANEILSIHIVLSTVGAI